MPRGTKATNAGLKTTPTGSSIATGDEIKEDIPSVEQYDDLYNDLKTKALEIKRDKKEFQHQKNDNRVDALFDALDSGIVDPINKAANELLDLDQRRLFDSTLIALIKTAWAFSAALLSNILLGRVAQHDEGPHKKGTRIPGLIERMSTDSAFKSEVEKCDEQLKFNRKEQKRNRHDKDDYEEQELERSDKHKTKQTGKKFDIDDKPDHPEPYAPEMSATEVRKRFDASGLQVPLTAPNGNGKSSPRGK